MRTYAARAALITACLAAAGCAALERDVVTGSFRGPSGNQAYSMACSGGGRSIPKCYARATELCGQYTVISQTATTLNLQNRDGRLTSVPAREMVVECKAP